jgi:hypothetical protein
MNDNKQKPHYLGHRKGLWDRFLKSGFAGMAEHEVIELLLTLVIDKSTIKDQFTNAIHNPVHQRTVKPDRVMYGGNDHSPRVLSEYGVLCFREVSGETGLLDSNKIGTGMAEKEAAARIKINKRSRRRTSTPSAKTSSCVPSHIRVTLSS